MDRHRDHAQPFHDRMPLIIAPGNYARWLGEEPDPHDLMEAFPAAPMRMWPISTRVNKLVAIV
jgi:putative SOS response-associated peptidase YedK